MASSSVSPSTPAFCSQAWKYHVFLSFRGEDTRKTFVDHLYTTLVQKGIYTYKDDETLPRGESIGPSLMTAIEESQIAIIIFSKSYADSSWCLDELAHIMKCKDTKGQIVMPIFYDVDPSEVRKQKRKYGEAFVKHESENKKKIKSWGQAFLDDPLGWFFAPREQLWRIRESQAKYEVENKAKVETWRKALVDASNISGWEPQHIANGYESKFIMEIIDTISQMLHPLTSSVDDHLVGVKARMQVLISKSKIGLGGKRMIGIWGVGGGGKTTLASSIYNEISSKFDGSCFIKNVREESSNKNGLENLQEKILCGVLQQKQVHVGRVEEGRRLIKDRLHHLKVLIVLDDVDNLEHLEELAGSRDWFGEGSRIVITTRDEHVLKGHKVDVIHSISLLNSDEAMELFCKHAPCGDKRIEDYEVLSKHVVSYAGGLPLALRVLGRFLCDKEINEWRSALDRLKEIPDANILEKLKISFDGLRPVERELFLDIACFFKGPLTDKDRMSILDACGFHPVIGIKVLVQKALITIREDGVFDMHDLVEEMAHYIVRGERPQNPEYHHSRVWKREDFLKICAMDAMTNLDRIEAIDVKWWWWSGSDEERVLQVTANMKRLRWIRLDFNSGGITLPENFLPGELRCLTLCNLSVKQIWEGNKFLPNLRMIRLDGLSNLMMTPDFEGLPNLERFMVRNARLLEEIHPSFGHLEKLVYVEIKHCDNLKMVPPITRSEKLETLKLFSCTKLFNSSKIQHNMENIVPHKMNSIKHWFCSGCLRKLDLRSCNLADGDITSAAWELPNLQQLNLSGNGFVRLDFSLLRLTRLKFLAVLYCEALVQLSGLPSSISVVLADNCALLESFGDVSNCKWLWKVSVWGGKKLGPLVGDILLDSMLQGNAKDYFISINVSGIDIRKESSVLWLDLVKTYNMALPHDWYNAFSGILVFVKSNDFNVGFDIVIKQGVDEDFQCELGQESIEAHYQSTFVGYVSFSSLRHTGCLNSTYNIISFSFKDESVYKDRYKVRAVFIPKDDPMQTTRIAATESSEFWDEKEASQSHGKTFTIRRESNSSIKIRWEGFSHLD